LQGIDEYWRFDGIKGNFAVSEREYTAYGTIQQSSVVQQVIHSNVKEIVEQQRYVFENFWNRAISAQIKIREIEEGFDLGITEVIYLPTKIRDLSTTCFLQLMLFTARSVLV